MTNYAVAVGDTVVQSYGGRTTREGTVLKIGTKRIYVGGEFGITTAYERDTQQRCDGRPGNFQTLQQVADRKLELEARGRLLVHGVMINYPAGLGSPDYWPGKLRWTAQQLVELVKAVEQIHPQE